MFHAFTPVLITRILQENAGELRSLSEVFPGGVRTSYRDFNQTFNRCDKVPAHTSMLPQYVSAVCKMLMFLRYAMLLIHVATAICCYVTSVILCMLCYYIYIYIYIYIYTHIYIYMIHVVLVDMFLCECSPLQ